MTMRFNHVAVTLMILLSGFQSAFALIDVNVTGVIDSLLANYDKRICPGFGNGPVDVGVSMHVISISSVSSDDMDYTMHFYFRQTWKDPRLAFEKKPGLEEFTFGHEMGHEIWLPDTFFVNEKESFKHAVTVKNEFIRIKANGEIRRSHKLTVTASCAMNFQNFPKDKQTCSFDIESFAHKADDGITYYWIDGSNGISIDDTMTNSQFNCVGHEAQSNLITLKSGNYSRLSAHFMLQRNSGYYVPQVYIPCTMLVILSWLTFWLKPNASHVRLTICVLTFALMVVGCQTLTISNLIPRTSYLKSIDLYTGVSIAFIFLALVEFAFVSNAWKNNKDNDLEFEASKVDKIFRIIFPIAFLIFNFFYSLAF